MTDKEKAIAYDKLLVKAKQIYNKENDVLIIHTIEDLFPDLKESENEKTKKGLIDYFSNFHLQTFAGLDPKKILDWLEEQDRQDLEWSKEENDKLSTIIAWIKDYPRLAKFNEEAFVRANNYAEWLKSIRNKYVPIKKIEHLKSQGEQKLADNPKPRFKAGQTIVNIYHNPDTDSGPEEIKEVTNDKYIFEGGSYIMISEQDYWILDGEPKFKHGEWIVSDSNNIAYIESVSKTEYNLQYKNGRHEKMSVNYVDKCWHSWTIQDVKDGEVLVEDTCTFIIKKLNKDLSAEVYCCLHDDGDLEINSKLAFDVASTYPATKEQRDLLFSKMKEEGYEWSEETKELKETRQEPGKPKFHEGEWIISDTADKDYRICKITGVKDGNYSIESTCGYKGYNRIDVFDNSYRPWIIEDAQDGEVLAAQECYVIFKEITGLNIRCYCTYHYMGFSPSLSLGTLQNKTAFHPATKEESDTLGKAITNGGLKWNAEKKEFTAIKPRFDVGDTIQYNGLGHNEYVINEVHYPTHYVNELGKRMDMPYTDANFTLVNHEDNRREWSEDDEQYLLVCKNALRKYEVTDKWDSSIISQWLDDKLKSLKDRAFPQQQEWSEEEKGNVDIIVSRLEVDIEYWKSRSKRRIDEDKRVIDWLKSLRPQNTWKPSKEQIIALRWVLNNVPYNKHKEEISGLLDQIKEL